jgi:NADH:ubiquinone reductase (non-electrogenic)
MAPNMRPFAAANVLAQVQLAGRRAYTTQRPSLIANRARWTPRPIQQQIALRQAVRRATTDAPAPKPRRRFRLLRWTWRLTYLSAFAGLGYIGYGIYEMRNPADQPDPDPSKKTLVVLGTGWGAVSLLKKLDTENYNVIVVSPRNYFLFTPLLPSCTVGTIEHRSIMEPIRNFLRHKKAAVKYYEAEATKIDYEKRIVYINDDSEIKGESSQTEVPFDMLVVGVGAENATFGASCASP